MDRPNASGSADKAFEKYPAINTNDKAYGHFMTPSIYRFFMK
jgi:hypothetical protein